MDFALLVLEALLRVSKHLFDLKSNDVRSIASRIPHLVASLRAKIKVEGQNLFTLTWV